MRQRDLAWGIIWRMAGWGCVAGAGLGFLYAGLLFLLAGSSIFIVASFAGFAVGGLLGLILGLIEGLVLALVTHLIFRRPAIMIRYRTIAVAISVLVVVLAAALVFATSPSTLATRDISAFLLYAVIPTLTAIIAAWIVTFRVVTWVERELTLQAGKDT